MTLTVLPGNARGSTSGPLPSTWQGRGLRVEYEAGGELLSTDATLLDVYPFGLVLNIARARALLSWDKIGLVDLREEAGL